MIMHMLMRSSRRWTHHPISGWSYVSRRRSSVHRLMVIGHHLHRSQLVMMVRHFRIGRWVWVHVRIVIFVAIITAGNRVELSIGGAIGRQVVGLLRPQRHILMVIEFIMRRGSGNHHPASRVGSIHWRRALTGHGFGFGRAVVAEAVDEENGEDHNHQNDDGRKSYDQSKSRCLPWRWVIRVRVIKVTAWVWTVWICRNRKGALVTCETMQ